MTNFICSLNRAEFNRVQTMLDSCVSKHSTILTSGISPKDIKIEKNYWNLKKERFSFHFSTEKHVELNLDIISYPDWISVDQSKKYIFSNNHSLEILFTQLFHATTTFHVVEPGAFIIFKVYRKITPIRYILVKLVPPKKRGDTSDSSSSEFSSFESDTSQIEYTETSVSLQRKDKRLGGSLSFKKNTP